MINIIELIKQNDALYHVIWCNISWYIIRTHQQVLRTYHALIYMALSNKTLNKDCDRYCSLLWK